MAWLARSIALLGFVFATVTAPAVGAAPPAPVERPAEATRAPERAPDRAAARYAEREASAKDLEQFEGGATVIIGATALTIALAIILLLVLT